MERELRIVTLGLDDASRIDALAKLIYAAFKEHAPGWLPTTSFG